MTADLLASKLLPLSLSTWKPAAQLQHISVTSTWLPNISFLHGSSYRLNHQPHYSALTVTASQINSRQVLCLRLLKALELTRDLCLPSGEAAVSEACPNISQGQLPFWDDKGSLESAVVALLVRWGEGHCSNSLG